MQPHLTALQAFFAAESTEASGGTPGVAPDMVQISPGLGVASAFFIVAVALTWTAGRAAGAPALQRWERTLNVLSVAAWLTTAWLASLWLLDGRTSEEMLGRALLVGTGLVAALPVLRDLVAALSLVVIGRYRTGDEVRVESFEGRIVRLGLRHIVLRARDQSEMELPNRRFVSAAVVRLNTAAGDAPCELDVAVPDGIDAELAMRRLAEAAVLSPYAAPGRVPEVFVMLGPDGRVRLHLRAFVFERAYEEPFRGDVVTRFVSVTRGSGGPSEPRVVG